MFPATTTIVTELERAYRSLFVLTALVPLALVIPTIVEGLQHFVEWRIGTFVGEAGFEAAGESTLRSGVAMLKIAVVLGTAPGVGRFWLHDRSIRRALCFGRRELVFLAGVLVVDSPVVGALAVLMGNLTWLMYREPAPNAPSGESASGP